MDSLTIQTDHGPLGLRKLANGRWLVERDGYCSGVLPDMNVEQASAHVLQNAAGLIEQVNNHRDRVAAQQASIRALHRSPEYRAAMEYGAKSYMNRHGTEIK